MTQEDDRLKAALAKHKSLEAKAQEHRVQRAMAERDEAAALGTLKDRFGVSSFDAGVALAADMKAKYVTELTSLEQALEQG